MSATAVSQDRGLRRLSLRRPARHRFPRRASTASPPTTSTSSSARTTWSPSTTATRASINELRDHCRAQPEDDERGAGRAVSPHRRRDGRSLPAGGREARGPARRARERGLRASASRSWCGEILDEKREVVVAAPGHHAAARRHRRLARREFVDISTEMSFRFRDVYDHLVRLADEATIFQDRITGILDAHLTNVSNRLNEVMKVLTVVSTSSCR